MKKKWNNPKLITMGVEQTKANWSDKWCIVCGKNTNSNAGCGKGNHISGGIEPPPGS